MRVFLDAPMTSFALPANCAQIKRVGSFHELVTTRFGGGINALCWERTLAGDYAEIVTLLGGEDGITSLDEARLRALPVTTLGRAAVGLLCDDLQLLRDHGLAPVLDCIHGYPRDEHPGPVPTDVYSFHSDSAPIEADTYLCTYHGPSSEGLRNEDAERRVDLPATRAELLRLFGGADDADFQGYLKENCYDLHYAAKPPARPFSFGVGNLWRIAVEYPGSPVPPCIHRAPALEPGQPPRLLLIS